MKAIISASKQKSLMALFILLVSLAKFSEINAQLPDCLSGTIMYAVFNDSVGSTFSGVLDSVEIRPVNYSTGAVGALMGGRRYWLVSPSGTYYGTSALAVDFASSRFFAMTQMSSGAGETKSIYAINTAGGTLTITGTTPASLNNYHFVKMAGHNSNGWIYAVGVIRDTTLLGMPANSNPIIRFPNCATANCATANIQLLGYFPSTGVFRNWQLFNGDIAFDAYGNLFFATAAFARVSGTNRYTDARLVRINAADLPTVPGTGVIPASLVADYNTLDSTVLNGMSFDPAGNMYFSTRRYLGPQNPPLPPYVSQLYISSVVGTATLMPGFVRPTPGTSAGDLAGCYFPAAVLATNKIKLGGQYLSGTSGLKWDVNNNTNIAYFEVERGDNANDFETVGRVEVVNAQQADQKYSFNDLQEQTGKTKYYRIRQVMKTGVRYYSNVLKLSLGKISLSSNIKPNPFTSFLDLAIEMKVANSIHVRMMDQNGRILYQRQFNGRAGQNNLKVSEVGQFKAGIYFLEVSVENEVIREKIVKL